MIRYDEMKEYEILSKLKRLKPLLLELDEKRFTSGYEWQGFNGAMDILFNPDNRYGLDADKRLLVFWICCVLDRQAPVEKVWNDGVDQSIDYLQHRRREYPQFRFDESRYLRKTEETLRRYDNSFIKWFASKIEELKPYGKGSLYRFTYKVLNELLGAYHYEAYKLRSGRVGLLGCWKRLWMFIMFLRRDKSYIEELVKEAFTSLPSGVKLLEIWYNDKLFSPMESELPVDRRVKNAFADIFGVQLSERRVAKIAHKFGEQEGVPPSILDVLYLLKKTGGEAG